MQVVAKASVSWSGRVALAFVAVTFAIAGCSQDIADHGAADGYSIKDSWAAVTASQTEQRRPVVRAKLDTSDQKARADRQGGAEAEVKAATTSQQPAGDHAPVVVARADGQAEQAELAARPVLAKRVDETCVADAACRGRIAELVADQGASLLRTKPALADDISGARFLAVRKLGPQLSCEDIEVARGAIAGSQERLALITRRAAVHGDEQSAATGAMNLAGAVLGDLQREQLRRCK